MAKKKTHAPVSKLKMPPRLLTKNVPMVNGPSTVTVTSYIPGFNGTSTIFPLPGASNTATTTEVTTVTDGGAISSQSDSGSTSTTTTLIRGTSYVNTTVTKTIFPETGRPSGTRVSVPGSLSLTFATETINVSCGRDQMCNPSTGTPISVLNMTETRTLTSTVRAGTGSTQAPFFPNTTTQTSSPLPTSVTENTTAEANTGTTTTVLAITTVTLTANGTVVISTIASGPTAASLSMGQPPSEPSAHTYTSVGTRTETQTTTVSVPTSASPSVGAPEPATTSAAVNNLTVTSVIVKTITPLQPNGRAANTTVTTTMTQTEVLTLSTVIAANSTLSSTETQILTVVLTSSTRAVPKFANTSTTTVTHTVERSTLPASPLPAVTSSVNASTLLPEIETSTTTVTVPVNNTVDTTESTSATGVPVLNNITTTTTAFVTLSDTPMGSPVPLMTTEDFSSTETSTITSMTNVSTSSTITVFRPTSVSTALPLYNSTLTGGAVSAVRVHRLFTFLMTLINLSKKINAAVLVAPLALPEPSIPVSVVSNHSGTLSSSPTASVPAHPVPVSISTTVDPGSAACDCTLFPNATGNASSTIYLRTTVYTTSTVYKTMTTSLSGAVPHFNTSTSTNMNSSMPVLSVVTSLGNTSTSTAMESLSSEETNSTSTFSSRQFGSLTPVPGSTISTAIITTHATTMHNITTSHAGNMTMTLPGTSTTESSGGVPVGVLDITMSALVLVAVTAWFVL